MPTACNSEYGVNKQSNTKITPTFPTRLVTVNAIPSGQLTMLLLIVHIHTVKYSSLQCHHVNMKQHSCFLFEGKSEIGL